MDCCEGDFQRNVDVFLALGTFFVVCQDSYPQPHDFYISRSSLIEDTLTTVSQARAGKPQVLFCIEVISSSRCGWFVCGFFCFMFIFVCFFFFQSSRAAVLNPWFMTHLINLYLKNIYITIYNKITVMK